MKLITYKEEIRAISRENNVGWDVARDMFLANIRNAGVEGAPHYAGADQVDYKALQAEIPALGTQAYTDMCNEFNRDFKAGK
jgi:hypothetical protein